MLQGKRKKYLIILVSLLVALIAVTLCLIFSDVNEKSTGYFISDAEDLVRFRDEVNSGNRFDNITVYQTADIDMRDVKNWTPIGVSGSGNYFYGSYNGGGHKIINLRSTLTEESSDNGLFGSLGGLVYNLGLENFYINGGCLGGIASSSADGAAIIFNCYVKNGSFEGTRGGAIADNFVGGKIMSCWADGCSYVKSDAPVPLCSYNAIEIYDSFSTGKIYEESTYTGKLLDNSVVESSYYFTDEFAEILNDNLFLICLNNVTTYNTLYDWTNGKNGTAFNNPCVSITSLTLEGKGTEGSPYLISSFRDLAVVACGVNEGRSFSGYWVRQTCDFDLTQIDSWLPIGVYNSNCYFYGTYDGGGHKIYNIYSNDSGRSRNNGFFGMLGGTVMNLGIESGEFHGECVGSIASHASIVTAKIINCYSKASVNGFARSGGIADNFIGRIENCVYYSEVTDVPLSSYHAGYLINTYTNTHSYNRDTFTGRVDENYVYGDDAYGDNTITLEGAMNNLNANLKKASGYVSDDAYLFSWKIVDGQITFDESSVVYPDDDGSGMLRLVQIGGIVLALGEALLLYYFFIYKKNKDK